MEVLIGLAVLAFIIWAFRRGRVHEDKVNAQYEMRFPTLDQDGEGTFRGKTFADFERMLLVTELSDFDYQHTRVYHLRRRDGPVWDVREEDASRGRSWAHLQEQRQHKIVLRDLDREEARLKDRDSWSVIEIPTLETAYQLFLRQHDPSVSFPSSPVDSSVAGDFVSGAPRPGGKASREALGAPAAVPAEGPPSSGPRRANKRKKRRKGRANTGPKGSAPAGQDERSDAEEPFTRAVTPSPALALIVGAEPIPRTEVVRRIWQYIREHGLQNTKEPRMINADEKLKAVFGGKAQVSMLEMTKLINAQLS